MEAIITSFANSIIANGTITEAHILLGIFIVTIIALRKTQGSGIKPDDYEEISAKITEVQQHIADIDSKLDSNAADLDQLHTDIIEIKFKLEEINAKIQL